MLEKLPAVLADAEMQPYAFHISVLGFPAGAVSVVSVNFQEIANR